MEGNIHVYEKIKAGPTAPHSVILGLFDARGREQGTRPVSDGRATFGFADEWGRVRYMGFGRYGEIEISYEHVANADTPFD